MDAGEGVPAGRRVTRGATVGAFCVLPLFEGLWNAVVLAGLPARPYPDSGVPLIVMLTLAGAVLGAGFGLAMPARPRAGWRRDLALGGVALGLAAGLALWFVLGPVLGDAVGRNSTGMARALTVTASWGFCLGLILPLWLAGWPGHGNRS